MLSFILLCLGAAQAGVTGSCNGGGFGPAPFDANSCANACSQVGSVWICDLEALGCVTAADAGQAWIVTDWNSNGTHDYSAYGQCGGTQFCCWFDDNPNTPLTAIELLGTPGYDDGLDFLDNNNAPVGQMLRPAGAADLKGYIHGREGGDEIEGSDFSGASYGDLLYGDEDDDSIHGNGDKDWISGGPGNDSLFGDAGDDRMSGDDGEDYLEGNAGHDVLCDSSQEAAGCAKLQGNEMQGGPDNDVLWYTMGAFPCDTQRLSVASDGGTGTNHFGDMAWPTPGSCLSDVMSMPLQCQDPGGP